MSNNNLLEHLRCGDNQLTSLDVSKNTSLVLLWCSENQLTNLDVSNNKSVWSLHLVNMPTLTEVCVWEGFPSEPMEISISGSPNVCFQTDCNGDCSVVGIEGKSLSEISIYPNPTNSLLTIETVVADHYSIEITALNGQQILIGEMEGTSYQIDLSSFQKGVYFITIRSLDFVTTRKIIKM